MKRGVDVIVGSLPPPGKLPKSRPKPDNAEEDAADGGADDAEETDYNPEEDAALAVAKALGIPEDKVDVPALCEALKDFQATTKG